jgi:hypothetical protein
MVEPREGWVTLVFLSSMKVQVQMKRGRPV